MPTLIEQTLAALRRLNAGRVGVIAISGGPDSVALAWLLRHHAEIILAHLNHQLRGDESDGDEAFVCELAATWNVPVITERIDVAARAAGRNLENTARDVRYRWLADVAQEKNAAWIATGHTADDQAETVLHHFLRGSGLAGLAGIAERTTLHETAVIRPLLTMRRADLVSLLKQNNIPFRVDSSNADPRFTRNRLRHEIIPLLEREINPSLVDVLTRAAAQAAECQAAVTAIASKHLADAEKPRAGDVLVFSRPVLAELDAFLVREIFRLVWRREGWPMGEMNTDDWRRFDAIVGGTMTAHDFPGQVHVRRREHVVQLWRT